jgi:imidazole glycerol-phosphate synthase subunit HisH
MKLLILDYGMGNLHSVQQKMLRLKTSPIVSSDPVDVLRVDKIILPGVGHFRNAMENLKRLNLTDALNEAIQVKKVPVLGICLGMQLLANRSEEGNVSGLGWLDADVIHFRIKDIQNYKIPHMGWNQISVAKESKLMDRVPEGSEFYFVHSFHFTTNDQSIVLNRTDYEYPFVSAVEKENIFGVQYHPEKSHDVGEQLLKNFISL